MREICTSGTTVAVEDLARVSPFLHRHVIRMEPTIFPALSRGSTCRRIRYRMFSQPGGLWAKRPSTPMGLCTPRSNFPGLKEGDRWCPLRDSLEGGTGGRVALPVDLEATHSYALEFVSLEELQAHALSLH